MQLTDDVPVAPVLQVVLEASQNLLAIFPTHVEKRWRVIASEAGWDCCDLCSLDMFYYYRYMPAGYETKPS